MEILLILSVLVGVLGLAGWAAVALFVSGEKSQKKATDRKDEFFDQAFDGRELVTFSTSSETPPAKVMIEGAYAKGYELTSRSDVDGAAYATDLVFTKKPRP